MPTPLADIPLRRNDGAAASLADYAGHVLLVVNVASKCGLTPQYDVLQALYDRYAAEGFTVLAFPSGDFGGQGLCSDAEIAAFCEARGVRFPLFAKTPVTGGDRHPLYAALTAALPEAEGDGPLRERLAEGGLTPNPAPEILWNFEKFVVGRDGEAVARFAPDVAPDDPRIVATIERELFASE